MSCAISGRLLGRAAVAACDGILPLGQSAGKGLSAQAGATSCSARWASSGVVDLRSDTVTRPSAEMRQAMATAEVGDDVWGDDPTVAALQTKAADMFGMERALFVPSGTMGNLISVMAHCTHRGAEVLLGSNSHILQYEQGGLAQIAGIHPREVRTFDDGRLDLQDLKSKVRIDDIHLPVTSLICLENTHNLCGGRVLRPEYMAEAVQVAKELDVPLHVDGARIFNAATALDIPVSGLLRGADSVSVCLSKGLAAPVGSIIGGSEAFCQKALRVRKVLGGGLRQAGVLAAPGLISLEVMSQRLHEDHALAKRLSEGCHAMQDLGLDSDPDATETNIVMFSVDPERAGMDAVQLADRVAREDSAHSDGSGKQFLLWAMTETCIRAVTHYQISTEDVEAFLARMRRVLSAR